MTYQPFVAQRFGGLNVQDDPQEVGPEAATSLLNVDLDKRGTVRTRAGAAQYDTSGGTSDYSHVIPYYQETAAKMLLPRIDLGAAAVYLDLISAAGTTISNIGNWQSIATTAAPRITGWAALGTPTASYLYIASRGPNEPTTLRRYDGSVLASSVGAPAYVAVTPTDNRLAQAWFGAAADSPTGANGSTSSVFFSDPGAPATYGGNNYVHLRPGDGEAITGMVAWNEMLFVAKQRNLFIFYNTGVGSTGDPIFNYRRVAIPARISNLSGTSTLLSSSVIAGEDGVYFATVEGIFRSTGGDPVRVSGDMTPIWDGTADSSLAMDHTAPTTLSVANERVYLNYTTTAATARTLVYDTNRGFWTVWGFPVTPTGFAAYGTKTRDYEGVFFANGAHVYKMLDSQTTDFGTAIASHWQSGCYELGESGKPAYTRWTRLWGSGAPTVSVFTDMGSTDANAAAVTLGTAPAKAEGYQQVAYKGLLFQHKLSATSGQWAVNRVTHDVSWVRR